MKGKDLIKLIKEHDMENEEIIIPAGNDHYYAATPLILKNNERRRTWKVKENLYIREHGSKESGLGDWKEIDKCTLLCCEVE